MEASSGKERKYKRPANLAGERHRVIRLRFGLPKRIEYCITQSLVPSRLRECYSDRSVIGSPCNIRHSWYPLSSYRVSTLIDLA